MNKNESKYFKTAAKMDEAFWELLEKKDLPFITVKEICHRAGVNRSTFYLHYETIDDLLRESVEHMYNRFLEHMQKDSKSFIERIYDSSLEDLYLITPEYLVPYLNFIKEHRRPFSASIKNAKVLRLDEGYDKMFLFVITPILERFNVPVGHRKYMMSFYINGIMAVIAEWLKDDCKDSTEKIIEIIRQVIPYIRGTEGESSLE